MTKLSTWIVIAATVVVGMIFGPMVSFFFITGVVVGWVVGKSETII